MRSSRSDSFDINVVCLQEGQHHLIKEVKSLLRYVPKDHLYGLQKIVITDIASDHRVRDRGGAYYSERQGSVPMIELCTAILFKGIPKALFFIPFLTRFIIADALFHEIGHHYQKKIHGIKKEEWEQWSERYSKEMTKKALLPWFIALIVLFWPFLLVRRFKKRRV